MPSPGTTGARKNYCGLRGCGSSLGLVIDPGGREVMANRVAVCERGEQAAEPRHNRRARSGPGRSAPAEDHFRVCSLAGCQCLAHVTDERTGRRPRKIRTPAIAIPKGCSRRKYFDVDAAKIEVPAVRSCDPAFFVPADPVSGSADRVRMVTAHTAGFDHRGRRAHGSTPLGPPAEAGRHRLHV